MDNADDFRSKLGSRLVLWSTLALVLLAIVIVIGAILAEKDDKGALLRTSQLLLSTLLPLFGTWVGTILAFYYTKENYESASRGTLDLVRSVSQQLSSTPVADKMMRRADIIAQTVPAGGSIGNLSISGVENQFTKVGKNGQRISRLLILDSGDACVAILHRSVYAEMLSLGLRDNPAVDPTTGNLGVLLSKPYASHAGTTYEDFIRKTIAFVAQDRTLADAKAAMEQVPDCQDVIVTKSGQRTEPVVGWISNVDISRLSQA